MEDRLASGSSCRAAAPAAPTAPRRAGVAPNSAAIAARSSSSDVSSNAMPTRSASMHAQQPAGLFGRGGDLRGAALRPSTVTVSKNSLAGDGKARRLEPGGKPRRPGHGHALAIACRPSRPVPDRIGRRHVGEQRLRRADVGGRLVAADVLLARLQRQPVAGPALACRPTGRRDGRASAGSACRTPRNRRHADRQNPSARRSAAWSRPRCRRRASPAASAEHQRQRVGDEDHQRASRLGLRDRRAMVAIDAERIRPRHDQRRDGLVDRALVDRRCRAARRASRPRRGSADAARRRARRGCAFRDGAARRCRPLRRPPSPRRAARPTRPAGRSVRSTSVWKWNSSSSRPWLISDW